MHAYMNTKRIQPCTHIHTCISQCSRHLAKANINARPFQGLSCPSRRLLALRTRLLAPSSLRCLSARFCLCIFTLTDTHTHTQVQICIDTHIEMYINIYARTQMTQHVSLSKVKNVHRKIRRCRLLKCSRSWQRSEPTSAYVIGVSVCDMLYC